MGILSQGSFLGEATNRIYRALGLDGVVRLQVDGTIQPVVILADGTLPGSGLSRGRRFKGACNSGGGATVAHFIAAEDIIIDRLVAVVGGNAGVNTANVRLGTVGITTQVRNTAFLDRNLGPTDLAPVLIVAGGVAAAGFTAAAGTMFETDQLAGLLQVNVYEVSTTPFLLSAGQSVFLQTLLACQCRLNFEGRTF